MCERCGQAEEKHCLYMQPLTLSNFAKHVKMRLRSKSDSTHDRSKFKFRRTRRKRSDGDLTEETFHENGDVVPKVRSWSGIIWEQALSLSMKSTCFDIVDIKILTVSSHKVTLMFYQCQKT